MTQDSENLFQLEGRATETRLALIAMSAVEGDAALARIDALAAEGAVQVVRRNIPLSLGPRIGMAIEIETLSDTIQLVPTADGAEWRAAPQSRLRIGLVPAEADSVFLVILEVSSDAPDRAMDVADSALQRASVRDGRPLSCCTLIR